MNPSEPAASVAEVALARGERHRADGRLEAAELAYFEAASEAGSASGAAQATQAARHVVMRSRIGLGRIELTRGSPDRALGWFLNARDAAPDDWEPLYWQGCAQGRLADHQGADRSFTAALRHNPGESSIAIQRSYVRFKIGDLTAALDGLLDAQRQGELDDAGQLVLAALRFERREWAQGETILRALLDKDPANVRASELMGVALEWQAQPEEAIQWYGRAAGPGDASPLTCGRLGILHARAGRYEVALEWLRRARRTKRPDDRVLYYSGWVSFQLGDFQESIDDWTKLQRRHPGRQLGHLLGTARHELARERLAAGDYDAALPLLADCIDAGIGGCAAIRALAEVRLRIAARVLADRGRAGHDTAKGHLRAAAALSSDDYRFPFLLAVMQWADGNPSTALPQLSRACGLAGASRPARLAAVRCALEAGDLNAAEQELLRVADQPGQQVRRLAGCLGAGRWSPAADLLLAADEPDLAAELLGHCLVLAGRGDEADLSSQRAARAGVLHGLATAAQGDLDEARSMLAAVIRARPDLAAARVGLSHVERLLAIRAVEAGSWHDAAGLLAGSPPAEGRRAPAPLLEGLMLLVAGRSGQASSYLEEALRRDPADPRVRHAVSVRWLNGGQESVATPAGIAAVAALLNDEDFWERFRSSAASRYQAAVPAAALAECRRHIERCAYARAGPHHELILLRELTAAGALRDLGGFPAADKSAGLLVCGPLMISLVGLERAWGDLFAQEPAPNDSRSDQWRQLRQLFSGLGVATALLMAQRPEQALAALDVVACERCRSATTPQGYPKVCAAACPNFDARHPSYARLPGKGQRLAEDAAGLLVTARLAVAQRVVSSDPDDVGAATRLWADAISAAAMVGAQEQTQRQIADTALGRAKALDKAERLSAAIMLVEAAQRVLAESPARDELRSQLGQLLCDRGVIAANDGRLEPALDDLRRAADLSPHSPRPLVNLSLALQRLADQRRDLGDRPGEYESLRDAKRMLERAAAELSGSPEFDQQLVSVRKELRTVCNRWALNLAGAKRYQEALEVLDQGLAELPDDAALRKSQQTVQKYATPLRDERDPDRW